MNKITDDKVNGEFYEFTNNAEMVIKIWINLAENSKNEWSYTEYRRRDVDITYSRIATSFQKDKERMGPRISFLTEFGSNTNLLSYWGSVHNHPPPGQEGLSDTDERAFAPIYNTLNRSNVPNFGIYAYDFQNLRSAYSYFDILRNKKK